MRSTSEVIIEQIEIKFANRVIPDQGLCICFYDFLEVGDPYIYPGEGGSIQEVKFRLIMFKPFIGGKCAVSLLMLLFLPIEMPI